MALAFYYLMKSKQKNKLSAYDHYSLLLETIRPKLIADKASKCRVCLQDGSTPIYGHENTTFITDALHLLGGIQVNENDDNPKYLCDICETFIKGAILFRKISQESDYILKQSVKEEVVDSQSCDQDQDLSNSSLHDTINQDKWESEDSCDLKPKTKVQIKYLSRKLTCKICNKVINRSYYKEHLTMHDPNHKKFVCDTCGKSFRLRCAYYNHRLKHRTDFPYKCQFCPYRGRYSALLKTHMRTHTGDYRYMCSECPARFLTKSNFNRHALKHKEPMYKCDTCDRRFHSKLLLERHFEANHLGINKHICNICGKAFGFRKAMMSHQRLVHKREKLMSGRMPSYILEAENNINQSVVNV